MNRLLLILMAALASTPAALAREETILARITVYWPIGSNPELASSNGARLHEGHCAVDPKKIPYGSQVIFPDKTCLAIDSGPAVVRRTAAVKSAKTAIQRQALVIDRFFENKAKALAWAATHPHFMQVQVLDPHHKGDASIDRAHETQPAESTLPNSHPSDRPLPSRYSGNASLGPTGMRGSQQFPTFFGTTLPRS